ncbi:MAG: ATP-binding protein [Rhodobacteraceae bacterium]|nr:ATP-binding protein [Paracoccaceae bacterium]
MAFELRTYVPRRLYARAALILLLPIVSLQLVVSVVFIQRHFEGVTRQMTSNVLVEMRYFVTQVNAAPDRTKAQLTAEALGPQMQVVADLNTPVPTEDKRDFFDLSGRIVIETLRTRLPGVTGIDLVSNHREVQIGVETAYGPLFLRVPRERVSASNPHQLLVLMIFTGLLTSAVSILFLRNQVRPIRRLARAAEAFGKGRTVPYKPSGATEVRAAGRAFLDMRTRIERQIEQRTLMLSGVSHDLRTPLTRMKLALSVMEDSPDTRDLLTDVEDMERLVGEFLSFARGDALDDAALTDPTELLKAVVSSAQRAGRDVVVNRCIRPGTMMMMRPMAVSRALDNLIGNAVSYGTRAWVSLDQLDRAVRFRVEDDGPGIPTTLRNEALKPFARLDPARNQSGGAGVGLGLAIAADIARNHGGRLALGESLRFGGLQADLIIAR